MPQARRPAGTPTGGQFAPMNRPEATGIELNDDDLVEAVVPAEHSTVMPAQGPAPSQVPAKSTEQRIAALDRYTHYGPEYDRNVATSLGDHHHFARLGEVDNAEHYLLLAETQAGLHTWDEHEELDPFRRIARERQAAEVARAAEALRLTVEEMPVASIRPGDLVWFLGSFYEVTDDPEDAVAAGRAVKRIPVQCYGAQGSSDPIRQLDIPADKAVMGWPYRGEGAREDADDHGGGSGDGLQASVDAAATLSQAALLDAAEDARQLTEPVDTTGAAPGPPARPSAKEVIARIFPNGEPNRGVRRHKLLTEELVKQIPGLYDSEETPVEDKLIFAHYFTASADWHIAELDRETGEMFGRCDLGLGFPEWGYVSIQDLAELKGQLGLPVERDLDFKPRTARELGLAKERQP